MNEFKKCGLRYELETTGVHMSLIEDSQQYLQKREQKQWNQDETVGKLICKK